MAAVTFRDVCGERLCLGLLVRDCGCGSGSRQQWHSISVLVWEFGHPAHLFLLPHHIPHII